MKKLTRMKVINWHRFTNCTIDFGGATLISGENGAGKSTLLDAIQFVILCSANSFNKAAHENGKRKLTGYIRCKTGRENKPYERTGALSAHVALEFYEEKRNRYFVIGAVVDSASEGQETTVRYLIDNQRLEDEMFLKGKQIKSIAEFRTSNKGIKQWCKAQTEARKMMTSRLGRIEDKFFSLIPKALAFKPIDDIKDFVYSYVLDKKDVNIDVLRENVRTYQELERILDSVKKRMEKLEKIEQHYKEVRACLEKDRMYAYFLQKAELDMTEQRIGKAESDRNAEQYRMEQAGKALEEIVYERNEKRELETNLRVELKQNKEFLALEEQENEKKRLLAELESCMDERKELKKSITRALAATKKLLQVPDVDPCIGEYTACLREKEESMDIAKLRALTDEVIRYKQNMYGKIQSKIAKVQIELDENKTRRQELNWKIENLEKKKLTYPESVEIVLQAVKEEFARIGRKTEPHILCELLEIKEEAWRNAVEGYLNTQRFYILTEPESFDIALGIYEKLRREKKAFGVGLINTRNMEKYETAPQGTLATVVTSANPYASRYINMVLGKVQMCGRYEELKKYPTSITQGCMRYQNRVASAIRPEIFSVPFIGKHAFKVQLLQAKERREALEQKIKAQEAHLRAMQSVFAPLSTEADIDIKYRLEVLTNIRMLQNAVQKCEEHIRTLKKNTSLIKKQIQLEALEKIVKDLDKEISRKNQQIGQTEQKIKELEKQRERLLGERTLQNSEVLRLAAEAGDALPNWKKEYETQTAQKTLEQFYTNYERRQKANVTLKEKAKDQMTDCMIRYKTEHDFGAAATLEGFPEFAAVYDRLKHSELLEYEEKVQTARRSAEEEFREQFLAKLQENMKQAQGEFKELNRALKDITFSNERYEFLFMPSKKYRSYYEMIMDDFNVLQGESIFSGMFHETHKAVIDELFERLAFANENSAKTLDEFTDYRTYMDYDIKIIHSDDHYSYYSKVCEEKSGGETQTPFYVTVAASFVQLYGNNIGGEAAGLVMFDEAFNNMDDERIGGVLEFLRRLPLQMIIAAPPDKIQYIGPVMDETLLVMTDEKISFVEEYHHAAV